MRAFQRPRTPRDELPAWFRLPRGETVTDSRLVASYFGRPRPARLYLIKTKGERGRMLCHFLFHRGAGGGCSPMGKSLGRDHPVAAGSGQLLAGVAANHVARIVVVGSAGRRHPVRLTPDQGFIFDCRAYNGCTCVVAFVEAYDVNGKLLSRDDWRSSTCKKRR